jgi:hypothetical protein
MNLAMVVVKDLSTLLDMHFLEVDNKVLIA